MSIHERNGRYWVRYRSAGKQRSRTFDSKRDAEAFDRQVKLEKQRRGMVLIDRGSRTLNDFADQWWEAKRGDWSEQTRSNYRGYLTNDILKPLGSYELRQITPGLVDQWAAKLKRDRGADTVKKIMAVLSGMMKYAVLNDLIDYNPVREVEKPKKEQKTAPWPYSPSEIETIRGVLKPRDATIVSVLGYMGSRPAEALRLRWDDVHETTATIRDRKRRRQRPGLILPPLAQDLKVWKLQCPPTEDNLVFPDTLGTEWSKEQWSNWRTRTWHPALRKTKLWGKDNRPYRLRSSFVSLLLADSSYSLTEVAMYAGHSLDVMSRHYAGIIAEFQGRNINAADEIRKARQGRKAA